MKTPIIYDLQVEYADVVLTVYLPNKKLLNVFYNAFAVIDNRQLNYDLKDAFPEVNKIFFWDYKRPVIGETPFEQLRDVILAPNAQVFSWDASSEEQIKQADKLCSPYQLRHTKKTIAKTFINVNKLNEKAATVGVNHKRQYPLLETQSAYAGLSIPIYPILKHDRSNALVPKSLTDLIFYSVNRTINTTRLLQTPLYRSVIETKQDVINSYNLKAKIDDTDSTISSLTLTKNKTVSFIDAPSIEYLLEVNGHTINLLSQLYEEKVIPKSVFNFYKKIEGCTFKNYRSRLGKRTKIYVPYYDKNLNPVNSYATFSLGGNHGSYAKEKLDVPFDYEESNVSPTNQTQQFFNAFSIDVENCYPSMNVKLKIFENSETHDYKNMLDENLKIKHSLPTHKNDWSDKDYQNARKRKKLKSILNTATGAADRNDKYGILHLNNKTMTMRILVNLIIYELGTKFVRELNAKIISTNTDGIKIAFDKKMRLDEVQSIAKKFTKKYGLHFSVKQIDRILVKDTNNEIEWHNSNDQDIVDVINGKLGKGYDGKIKLDGNLDHPIIIDMAVVSYLSSHRNLELNDARNWINNYLIQKTKDKKHFDGMQWALFIKPSASTKYVWNKKEINCTYRFFFSKQGQSLTAFNKNGRKTKIRSWPDDKVDEINVHFKVNKIAKSINISPYLEWALKVLNQWRLNDHHQLDLCEIKSKQSQEKFKVKSKNSVLGKYLQESERIF